MAQLLLADLIEQQLAQIDLLIAMFPDEGSVSFDETSLHNLDALRTMQTDNLSWHSPNSSLNICAVLTLQVEEGAMAGKPFQLDIAFPFIYDHGLAVRQDPLDEPPSPSIRLLQPSWMSKAEAAKTATPSNQDIFTIIQHFQDTFSSYPQPKTITSNTTQKDTLMRIWFYFPSISTRSKRQDIVKYAPLYELTGFLLSGKPGILCLEGTSDRVDAYMRFIKTESWSDIPAYHKKVTERLRETGITRIFSDITEITDLLERRGERANRGDMKLLEAWLGERGLGEELMKVLI